MALNRTWPREAIVYQIYPRSFMDSNSDGIGDIKGIIQKLDYLKDLGIDVIWLSPVFKSPMVDMGYDVSDYKDIDPVFGSLKDFDNLIAEAHQRDIKLLMDYVPNHTSSKHPWFIEARKSKHNPKRDFYIWRDPKADGSVPNNWLSVFGGSSWELDNETGQYYYHSFDKEQPDLNWRNPAVAKEMLNVLRFWLDRGIDGFRIDAPEWTFKDTRFLDETPNPWYRSGEDSPHHSLQHEYTVALPESSRLIKKFAQVLEEYEGKFMVTESWSPVEELIQMYNIVAKDFYAPFNFGLITLPWKAATHKNYIDQYDKAVIPGYLPTYVLGNHDKSRIASRVERDQARIGAMLQLTLRGIPFIYYGEELGMEDSDIPKDQIQDTYELNSYGLGLGRDPERTPMQWNNKKHAGFSTVEPWLPVNKDYKTFNVEKELNHPKSFLSLYKKLIQARRNSGALTSGSYESLEVSNDCIFAYTRTSGDEECLVVLNYSGDKQIADLNIKGQGVIVCSTHMEREQEKLDLEKLTLKPNEGLLIRIN